MHRFWPKVVDAIAIHISGRLDSKARLNLQIKKKKEVYKVIEILNT